MNNNMPGSGLPFAGNTFDVAAQMVVHMYAHRQNHFIVATAGSTVAITLQQQPPHPPPTAFSGVPPSSVERLCTQDVDIPRPPEWADFLLIFCATSEPAAEAIIGCMNERFVRHCAKYGRRRATWFYWAQMWRSGWPLLRQAASRALKWAAILSALKHYFLG